MVHRGSRSNRLIQHDTRSRSHSGSLQTPLNDSLDKQPTPFPPTQSATPSHRLPAVQLKARVCVCARACVRACVCVVKRISFLNSSPDFSSVILSLSRHLSFSCPPPSCFVLLLLSSLQLCSAHFFIFSSLRLCSLHFQAFSLQLPSLPFPPLHFSSPHFMSTPFISLFPLLLSLWFLCSHLFSSPLPLVFSSPSLSPPYFSPLLTSPLLLLYSLLVTYSNLFVSSHVLISSPVLSYPCFLPSPLLSSPFLSLSPLLPSFFSLILIYSLPLWSPLLSSCPLFYSSLFMSSCPLVSFYILLSLVPFFSSRFLSSPLLSFPYLNHSVCWSVHMF